MQTIIGGLGIGGMVGSTIPPVRDGQVSVEMQKLEARCVELANVISGLENKLSSLLSVLPPQPTEPSGKEICSIVPLAGAISKQEVNVKESVLRIQDILNRIEL